MENLIERDKDGVAHVVALSGGHDSTIMSFLLQEAEPRIYNYVCTPTGNELPEMFDFWNWLGSDRGLGRRLIPIMHERGLKAEIIKQGMLPNSLARWCTRILKIEAYIRFLKDITAHGPVVSYVGLRADEPGRAGGAYNDFDNVTMRFPLREWGMGESHVQAELAQRGIIVPDRTDCAWCYHQTLGEWWKLWRDKIELYLEAEALEQTMGHTFRSDSRDTWPASLKELRLKFEAGHVPTRGKMGDPRQLNLMRVGACRVCSL